ncbi:hypothetical protein HPB47_000622 [Ixodes persulcatus]|uniref:Uncharacterized protein n=1 Tax=Ixodes persulcatus TaxID=34615 RepID=A0AC60PRA9_IXOPE|nr:hypothetical protein HPB47_000622 [Ixodes persulcatus]
MALKIPEPARLELLGNVSCLVCTHGAAPPTKLEFPAVVDEFRQSGLKLLEADKTSVFVPMNEASYGEKVESAHKRNFVELKKRPSGSLRSEAKTIYKNNISPNVTKVSVSSKQYLSVFFTAKSHKPETPFRSIATEKGEDASTEVLHVPDLRLISSAEGAYWSFQQRSQKPVLPFSSNHFKTVKVRIVKSLISSSRSKSYRHLSASSLGIQIGRLIKAGYSRDLLSATLKRLVTERPAPLKPTPPKFVAIPNNHNTTHRIKVAAWRCDTEVGFTSSFKLCMMCRLTNNVPPPQDRVLKEACCALYALRHRSEVCPASAAAAGPCGNTLAPPKSHAFDVTVPAGTPVDAIIAAAAAIVTRKVFADQAILLTPVGPVITSITCMFLPLFFSDETLKKSLVPYGQILEITHGVYKDNPSVKTGIRYLKMKMKEDNPPVTVSLLTTEAWFECAGGAKRKDILKHNARWNTAHGAPFSDTTVQPAANPVGVVVRDTPRLTARVVEATHPKDVKATHQAHQATSAATSASEPDQSLTQAATPSRATLEGTGFRPWSTAGEEKDRASTHSEALVIDEEAPEDRKTFLESSSFSSTVSSNSHTDQDMPEISEMTKNPAA